MSLSRLRKLKAVLNNLRRPKPTLRKLRLVKAMLGLVGAKHKVNIIKR